MGNLCNIRMLGIYILMFKTLLVLDFLSNDDKVFTDYGVTMLWIILGINDLMLFEHIGAEIRGRMF